MSKILLLPPVLISMLDRESKRQKILFAMEKARIFYFLYILFFVIFKKQTKKQKKSLLFSFLSSHCSVFKPFPINLNKQIMIWLYHHSLFFCFFLFWSIKEARLRKKVKKIKAPSLDLKRYMFSLPPCS